MKYIASISAYLMKITTPALEADEKTKITRRYIERKRKHLLLSNGLIAAMVLSFLLFIEVIISGNMYSFIILILYELCMAVAMYTNRRGRLALSTVIYLSGYITLTALNFWTQSGHGLLWVWSEAILPPVFAGLFLPWWSSFIFGGVEIGIVVLAFVSQSGALIRNKLLYTSDFLSLFEISTIVIASFTIIGALYAYMFECAVSDADKMKEVEYAHKELEKAHAQLAEAYAKVEELSSIDSLTHIANHGTMLQYLQDWIDKARNENMHFVVLFCDIDHFKQVNDTYGHKAGDIILVKLAKILQNNIGTAGFAARYGGEEFLAVYPLHTHKNWSAEGVSSLLSALRRIEDMTQAAQFAEKIRTDVEKEETIIVGRRQNDDEAIALNVTASIGVAIYPYDGNSLEAIIQNADSAMYAAKRNGRNQVKLAANNSNNHSVEAA